MGDETGELLAIKALVRQRHMTYEGFCREWNKIAEGIDRNLVDHYPGHAQYYRWLKGDLRNKRPYPDACRILEAMFLGWSVDDLFAPYSGSVPIQTAGSANLDTVAHEHSHGNPHTRRYLDLAGAYSSRTHFLSAVPLYEMLETARLVRASGLSLNLLTQHYADSQIRRLAESGTNFQLLFLDPESEAMELREREEGYHRGFLAGLTDINIKIMQDRVREQLAPGSRERIEIGLSSEIVRYNIILIDDRIGVVQSYLPDARGVDSPVLLVEANSPDSGFFFIFDQVFTSLWNRAKLL